MWWASSSNVFPGIIDGLRSWWPKGLPDVLRGGTLPPTLRDVRNTFDVDTSVSEWWIVIAALLFAALLIMGFFHSRLAVRSATEQDDGDPQELFRTLLGRLELAETDKQLLREMALGARLAHPAAFLLSPAMLDRARQLWIQEKGTTALGTTRLSRIDDISVQLYDHVPAAQTPLAEPR